MEKTAKFTLKKETKGTYVFQEDSENPIVGSIYVRKSTFDGQKPTLISVTVAWEETVKV